MSDDRDEAELRRVADEGDHAHAALYELDKRRKVAALAGCVGRCYHRREEHDGGETRYYALATRSGDGFLTAFTFSLASDGRVCVDRDEYLSHADPEVAARDEIDVHGVYEWERVDADAFRAAWRNLLAALGDVDPFSLVKR